jgi:hypothetical protein
MNDIIIKVPPSKIRNLAGKAIFVLIAGFISGNHMAHPLTLEERITQYKAYLMHPHSYFFHISAAVFGIAALACLYELIGYGFGFIIGKVSPQKES